MRSLTLRALHLSNKLHIILDALTHISSEAHKVGKLLHIAPPRILALSRPRPRPRNLTDGCGIVIDRLQDPLVQVVEARLILVRALDLDLQRLVEVPARPAVTRVLHREIVRPAFVAAAPGFVA